MTPNEKRKATLAKNRAGALENGKRLRRRRIEAGLTQERASSAAGATFREWAIWEVGTRAYPARRLPAIAAAMGIPIASLLVDELVLAEIRLSPETLERIKREGRPAAIAAVDRIRDNLIALALAEATRLPADISPHAWAKPRRSREDLLAAKPAKLAALKQRGAAIAEERRQARKIA